MTYLTADSYGAECPWGGMDLELFRLELWSSFTWISLIFLFIYPFGVPYLMFLVMRYHRIPEMVKKKIGDALVTSMIADYMQTKTNAPSTRLAATLGLPPVRILSRLHVALCYRDFCRT